VRVFLDANVLFSAASPESATRTVLDAILRHAVAVTNEHAWQEARRNLLLKRAHLVDELDRLRPRVEFTPRMAAMTDAVVPPKDQPILGGAIGAGCTHLWTGDKQHFGVLYGRTISGTRIVSGRQITGELIAARWL